MTYLRNEIIAKKEERATSLKVKKFAPAGQSTQLIIGATPETDKDILFTANHYYKTYQMKRVYYSGYVPISSDNRLPAIGTCVPMLRENRLYQADWLLRFYGFSVSELFDNSTSDLDYDIDPKLSWALKNLHLFPIDINRAPKELLLRIPGVGQKSVNKILMTRRHQSISFENLQNLGIAANRAKYFINCQGNSETKDRDAMQLKTLILSNTTNNILKQTTPQLSLFL
ncbi:MAG: hypothetical protein H0V61_02495 [Chitinophagales bacterium]|nr:hypothetical protein [Chitinophagales bacterium]